MLPWVGMALLLLLGSSSGSNSSRGHEELLQSFLHDLDVNQDANDIEADAESDFTVELFYKPPQHDGDQVKPLKSPSRGIKSDGSSSGEPVTRLWGVPDTTTTVGTLFSMAVPNDAFDGDVQHYQLKGVPSWLHWDGHRRVLEGVARPADRGHHYITIKAVGADGTKAKDVFSVDVTEMSSTQISRASGCSNKVDLTLASIVIDKSVAAMDAKTRARTLRAASKFLGVKKLSLTSVVQDLDPLADDDAILTGPGSSSHSGHGGMSQIQWVVGCGGEVSSSQHGTVDRLEATAKDGTLEQAIDLPVLGWTVVQVHAKTRRVRRQIDYSGDYPFDYKNYEYSDLEYDYDGDYDGDYEEEEYNEPDARVVPTLASPVFPDAPSATIYEYPGRESRPDYASMRPVPISTPIYVPVKPTKVVTIEASPTLAQPSESVYPTYYPDLESSITTQPVDTIEVTVPLTTSNVAEISPTGVIPPSIVTDLVVKNTSPEVNVRIPKLPWIAGHVYRMVIPENTFSDHEDGNTRNLKLVFKSSDGRNVGYSSWIQFDPKKQEIYALPLEDNIGNYVFYLEAMDSEGKSKTDTIMIHVQQPKEARNYNHKITATFKLDKQIGYELVYMLDWQVKAVEKISALYGDETTENINVRSISNNPHQISWTNVTLVDPRSHSCPEDELEDILQVLVKDNVEMEPNSKAKKAFEPEFVIKKVKVDYLVNCENYGSVQLKSVNINQAAPDVKNNPPDFLNPIDLLNATQGRLFIYKVKDDTCYDSEDGDSTKLKMRLHTDAPSPLLPNNWLQFDQNNQEFYGIPLAKDIGSKTYFLECSDSGGEKINDAMIVNVRGSDNSKQSAVEFQIVIQHINYDHFMSDSLKKKQLIEKIAEAFGDSNTDHVVVKSLSHGSVVVTWHNSSLPSEPCPSDEIRALREKMLDGHGKLLPSFVSVFHPFNVSKGNVMSLGACLGADTPTHIEQPEHIMPEESNIQDNEENDYLLNFIIPAIIIACMLLLAAIIACCLYRRRRYGKMTMTDDRTFVSKGIPIIFAEELDDRPDPAKSPIIMKDEKPPLPPPEYQRGSSPAASTPPTGDRRRPHSGDHGGMDDSPYQPPPPFTATNGASRHQRPNMPPTYRKPPTYVPP
ncbi:unnamed protein product [Meganyctiphanes norvegica]|uniref:Dystroglycan 1 n=1 Tax=Meganyctiphanes norvegica TaxID=48144 RepID=A0AAV2QZ76_MEGNR